jgi:phage baseplate assembly protein gpV
VVTIAESGISLSYGGFTVTMNSSGINLNNFVQVNGSGVTLTGTVTINGRSFLAHEHTGVQTGSGVSGGVL